MCTFAVEYVGIDLSRNVGKTGSFFGIEHIRRVGVFRESGKSVITTVDEETEPKETKMEEENMFQKRLKELEKIRFHQPEYDYLSPANLLDFSARYVSKVPGSRSQPGRKHGK